jgi:hypothetical protein
MARSHLKAVILHAKIDYDNNSLNLSGLADKIKEDYYQNLINSPASISCLVHTCKICGLELPTELRLENHKKVHAKKKSKISEYGDPDFNKYSIQA